MWFALSYSGNHPYHQDEKQYWFRAVWLLFATTKLMWFHDTSTGAVFAVTVPHGALIILSWTGGGGVAGEVEHAVTGAQNCWTLNFDFKSKPAEGRKSTGNAKIGSMGAAMMTTRSQLQLLLGQVILMQSLVI